MLKNIEAKELRKTILEMAYSGSAVHIGCAFSIVEILTVLYRNFLHYPDNDLDHPQRDYFILSKGHGVMAQYACMREMGWLSDDSFANYFSDGSKLMGLSDSRIQGLEVTSGSLGHGFSVGIGMALGIKIQKTNQKTYVLVGDGEINEGAIWEGALFASHHKLKNLMVIVDANGFQAMGSTNDVLNLGSIESKFAAFGFEALVVDGHDEGEINKAINLLWKSKQKSPKVLVAKTTKGKGVSFMENDNSWHYTRLNSQNYLLALQELDDKKL